MMEDDYLTNCIICERQLVFEDQMRSGFCSIRCQDKARENFWKVIVLWLGIIALGTWWLA